MKVIASNREYMVKRDEGVNTSAPLWGKASCNQKMGRNAFFMKLPSTMISVSQFLFAFVPGLMLRRECLLTCSSECHAEKVNLD
jgi:hypothetical protein